MYARILEFVPKLEKRKEFIKAMDDEVQPMLKKHNGFVDALLLFQLHSEKAIAISLWKERTYAEPYERECFEKVQEILKPYLTTPIVVKHYVDEMGLGGHFEKTTGLLNVSRVLRKTLPLQTDPIDSSVRRYLRRMTSQ